MSRYRVSLTPKADEQVMASYEWGVANWGEEAANNWVRELYRVVFGRLSEFPLGCSIAPESGGLQQEISQLLFGRYRILFRVIADRVIVMNIRGPFAGNQ